MGSSRKHKEKDRPKSRDSRKRRHRSKERDSDRDSRQLDALKHRRDKIKQPRLRDHGDYRDVDDEPVRAKSGSSGGDVSLSIGETNKLRLKLGLKPLTLTDGSSGGAKSETQSEESKKELDFVHKPAEDLTNKRFLEKLREKVAVQRQKRKIVDKLSKVKTLAESDSDEDVSIWVSKSRNMAVEKRKADERAKLIAEMDEEFGIGNLVEDEFKQIKAKAYSEKDLSGLTVQHAQTSFSEGQLTILTLQDKGVLDEEDDVLVNVNMLDDERAAKNIEVKKNKPTYNPYDNEEHTDDFGQIREKTLLSKYDEEIEGEKKKSFTIGASGKVRSDAERELIRQKLLQKQGVVSLEMPTLKIANEYYTEEEMVKFKKPTTTKVRKVRKKVKPFKADDLLRLVTRPDDAPPSTSDLGSRRKVKGHKSRSPPPPERFRHPWEADDMDVDKWHPDDDQEILGPEEDLTGVAVDPDEAGLELHLALNKARRLKQREDRKHGLDRMVEGIREYREIYEDDEAGAGKGSIVLNSTAEFCRALGDIPTYGMAGNRDEDVEDLRDYDEDLYGEMKIKEENDDMDVDDDDSTGAWNEVQVASPSAKVKKEEVTILDEEPDVGTGIAGALQLAMKKGYLEDEVKKVVSAPRHSNLEATSYTIEDKNMLEDDRLGRRERYCAGPVTDFRDKDGYKPDIKLEYIDDGGRLLSPKEAFRYLSHKFHGKGSGKNKTEKRMKKLQEESLMKRMSSTDTPLGTLALLQDKQKQTQMPYIVLSGGSKAINPSVISKTK